MKKVLSTAMMAAGAAMSLSLAGVAPAQAIEFNFNYQADTGYSATGSFSYDETTAPAVISEAGLGPTNFLQSLSLSVFAPSGTLLQSGSSVVNGVSQDSFLSFTFDTQAEKFTVLDTSTESSGKDPYYFISNFIAPDVTTVPPGSTGFNLFSFSKNTNTAQFLGTASSVQVSKSVPEPASFLGVLAFGIAGVAFRKKAVA